MDIFFSKNTNLKYEKQKKISVMHVIYSLDAGGAEAVVANFAKYHNNNIFRYIICVISGGEFYKNEIIKSKAKFYNLAKSKNLINFCFLIKFIRIIKNEKVCILHLHNLSPSFWGTLAGLISGVKVILRTEHNILLEGKNCEKKLKNFCRRWLGIFQKRIICVSNQVLASHTEKDKIFRKKYIKIYNGIDISKFSNKSCVDYRKQFHLPKDSTLIGKVARLTDQKGHEYILEAAKIIIERNPKVFFLIIGDGPKKQKLIKLAESMNLLNNVLFIGKRADVPNILKSIDIFVLSSLWEGFPMTIIEAMASGLPIIVTDVGGNSEAVKNGTNGILIPPKNSKELANAVFKLLENIELRKKMGKKSREIVTKKFTALQMVKKTENQYLKLLKMTKAKILKL